MVLIGVMVVVVDGFMVDKFMVDVSDGFMVEVINGLIVEVSVGFVEVFDSIVVIDNVLWRIVMICIMWLFWIVCWCCVVVSCNRLILVLRRVLLVRVLLIMDRIKGIVVWFKDGRRM